MDLRFVLFGPILFIVGPSRKIRALYLIRFNRGGQANFQNTFFQITKLRFSTIFADHRQNPRIFKQLKAKDFLESRHLHTYPNPSKNKTGKINKKVFVKTKSYTHTKSHACCVNVFVKTCACVSMPHGNKSSYKKICSSKLSD